MRTPDFNAALDRFLAGIKANSDAYHAKHFPNLTPTVYTVDPSGRKYLRIVSHSYGSRSVFCFIRIADGAVLMAAGWKAPAKHARGSIFVNDGMDAVGTYGAKYLRGPNV